MSFPRYPAYKDSGVEWLGEVPEHWAVRPLKYNLSLLTEKTDRRENPVALENIESWTGRFLPTETEFEGEGVAFKDGDILFGKLRPYLAKAYLATSSGEAVGDFHVLRPGQSVGGRFAQYQMLNREFIAIVDGSTFGSKMPRASWDFVGAMKVTTPPLPEQTRIAAFLDRETAKIDGLVAEQQRLIDLLKEKRQAVISHAVTKGLNPAALMKPSGVKWIGVMPSHWELTRLKYAVMPKRGIQMGPFGGMLKDVLLSPAQFKVYGQENTIADNFELGHRWINDQQFDALSEYELLPGDVVLTRKGASIGNCRVPPIGIQRGVIDSDTIRVRIDQDMLCVEFAVTLLHEGYMESEILEQQKGSVLPGLNSGTIANLHIALPPKEEQRAILNHLDGVMAKLNGLAAEAQRAIDLLHERRTALISAAVTGQIDVRHLDEAPVATVSEMETVGAGHQP
jgi:type I restriction enzyme S subunit